MANPILEAGQPAPDFTAETDEGAVTLSQLRGKPVVLYFYPRDNTPGCTTEACDFRDNFARVKAAGAHVLGVSPDTVKSHLKFRAKHELPFALIADPEHEVSNAYGVWRLKKNYGREYEGIVRSTFLIDADGTLAEIWDNARVKGHVDKVLVALEGLGATPAPDTTKSRSDQA